MSSLVIDVCGCSRVWRDRNWEFPEIPGSRGQLRRPPWTPRKHRGQRENQCVCPQLCRCPREILAVWTQ